MRIKYPEAINKEREALLPYLEFKDGVGFVIKESAPENIKIRHDELMRKIADIRMHAM